MVSTGFPERGTQVKRKADGLVGEVYASDPSRDLLTVRWAARSGHNTLVCTSEQFFRDWELTGKSVPSSAGPSKPIIIPIIFGVCFFLWLKACVGGTTSGFTFPSTAIDHKATVVNGNSEFDVTLKLREPNGSAPGNVFLASSEIIEIVKHELEEHSTEKSIAFHIVEDTGGGYDIYGRKQSINLTNAFDITYSMEDLMLINWDTVSGNGRWLLDLGTVSNVTGAGDDAIRKYCEDDGFKKYAQIFCANY